MDTNNKEDEYCDFCAAVKEYVDDNGKRLFIPCVFSKIQNKVIWIAKYYNQKIEKSIAFAINITNFLEDDFKRFENTGEKDNVLIRYLKTIGKFDDSEPCNEDICKDCPEYKKCQDIDKSKMYAKNLN